ncbi:hypothetical protein DL546_009385 [Coniochaeta pulveracea]|uniref:Uncharacterized protein n=1 Tax=Coniochaeta pulveracea TaxID=177199 RepID=A0A420YIP5_9PEZI|nr:hypothetical protein DL546_009385 [Coniochaeta pulveracea]
MDESREPWVKLTFLMVAAKDENGYLTGSCGQGDLSNPHLDLRLLYRHANLVRLGQILETGLILPICLMTDRLAEPLNTPVLAYLLLHVDLSPPLLYLEPLSQAKRPHPRPDNLRHEDLSLVPAAAAAKNHDKPSFPLAPTPSCE